MEQESHSAVLPIRNKTFFGFCSTLQPAYFIVQIVYHNVDMDLKFFL